MPAPRWPFFLLKRQEAGTGAYRHCDLDLVHSVHPCWHCIHIMLPVGQGIFVWKVGPLLTGFQFFVL